MIFVFLSCVYVCVFFLVAVSPHFPPSVLCLSSLCAVLYFCFLPAFVCHFFVKSKLSCAPSQVYACSINTSQDGAAPLFCAVQEGHWEVVDLLLENGADVNAQQDKGPTPLYIAAQEGYKALVGKLIKSKAEPNRRAHVRCDTAGAKMCFSLHHTPVQSTCTTIEGCKHIEEF